MDRPPKRPRKEPKNPTSPKRRRRSPRPTPNPPTDPRLEPTPIGAAPPLPGVRIIVPRPDWAALNAQAYVENASRSDIRAKARQYGVHIAESGYDTSRVLAQRLVQGVQNMSDSQLATVQDRIAEQNRAGGRARTPAEGRIPQGTDGRNAHGAAAATSSSGILPVTTRALPPDQTETPSHNPAAGYDTVPSSTSASSVVWPPTMPATAARPYVARRRPLGRARIMEIRKEIEQSEIPQGSTVESEVRRRVLMEQNRELLEAQQVQADQAGMASLEPASGASTPAHSGWTPVGPELPDHGTASDSPPSPFSESDVDEIDLTREPPQIDLTETPDATPTRREPDSPFLSLIHISEPTRPY